MVKAKNFEFKKILLSVLFASFISPLYAGRDLYAVLEVGTTATLDQIKRSYRRLAVRYHPDKNPNNKEAEEKFKELQNAYEILSNPEKRERYDLGPEMYVDEAPPRKSNGAGDDDIVSFISPEYQQYYDDVGRQRQVRDRTNFIHENYVDLRKTMSPIAAIIETLKRERNIKRERIKYFGFGSGELYQADTENIMREVLDEIMDDIFYSGDDIHSSTELALVDRRENQKGISLRGKGELAFSRLPSAKQIQELHKLYGKKGYYKLHDRGIQEARTRQDLDTLFHDYAKIAYSDEKYFLDTEYNNSTYLSLNRKWIVQHLEVPLERIYSGNKNVAEYLREFVQTKLHYKIFPTDRKLARNLIAAISDIGTPESDEALLKLIENSDTDSFLRKTAEFHRRRAQDKKNKSAAMAVSANQTSETKKHSLPVNLSGKEIEALKIKLREPLQSAVDRSGNLGTTIPPIDERFEAAYKLHEAGALSEDDFQYFKEAVRKYYWRYRTQGPSDRAVKVLLDKLPDLESQAALSRCMEEGWGYPAYEIAEKAIELKLKDPSLLAAFQENVAADRVSHDRVIEALGVLGNPKDELLLKVLHRKAEFRYEGRVPEPSSYAAALALGRMGAKDKKTIDLLGKLMKVNEGRMRGSGVPFAAALSRLGIADDFATRILQREVTRNPNGEREHEALAREALAMQPMQNSGSSGGNCLDRLANP